MSFDLDGVIGEFLKDENLIWIGLGLFLLLGDNLFNDINFLWVIALGVLLLLLNGDLSNWLDEDNWWWIAFLAFLLFDFNL